MMSQLSVSSTPSWPTGRLGFMRRITRQKPVRPNCWPLGRGDGRWRGGGDGEARETDDDGIRSGMAGPNRPAGGRRGDFQHERCGPIGGVSRQERCQQGSRWPRARGAAENGRPRRARGPSPARSGSSWHSAPAALGCSTGTFPRESSSSASPKRSRDWSRGPGAPLPVLPAYLTAAVADGTRTTHPDDASVWQDAAESVIDGRSDEFTTVYRRRWGGGLSGGGSKPGVAPPAAVRTAALPASSAPLRTSQVGCARVGAEAVESAIFQTARLTAIGEVASALSHELNQPLTVAMSEIQAATRTVRTIAPSQTCAAQVARRCARLRGTRRGDRAPVPAFDQHADDDARTIRRRGVGTTDRGGARPGRKPRGHRRRVDRGEGACEIDADRVQVEQVLLNLVRNGIEAAGAATGGPRTVTVAVRRRGAGVKVDVSDTGPGFQTAPGTRSSLRSSRPSPTAPASGCRSAARSWRPTAAV